MLGKLRDCSSRDASQCEVSTVKGDSAGGPVVVGCDPAHQVILPPRGKILNMKKVRLDKTSDNKGIQVLITVFGIGIGEDLDLGKLRYCKIVLMVDANMDDQHIIVLLLILLPHRMKLLIEEGHVFLVTPPLHRLKWSNCPHQSVYFDREKEKLLGVGLEGGMRLPREGGT